MRDYSTEAAGMLLKKEGAREMEMESGRETRTNKQEMREMARWRVGWTRGLHIDTICQEIITRVSE